MLINRELCIGCGLCTAYCPVHAITVKDKKAEINLDKCTECYNCKRANICIKDAIFQQELQGSRTVRSQMSDVSTSYKGVTGRGTEEMKTNDVTGRFKRGYCGIAVELGRPSVSTTIRDIEKIAKTVAAHGAEFEELNPITSYIINKETGEIDPTLLDERVISGIIEVGIKIEKLSETLNALFEVSKEIDTVFSLDVACRLDPDGTNPAKKILDEAGIYYRPNCKTNVGLGLPFYQE